MMEAMPAGDEEGDGVPAKGWKPECQWPSKTSQGQTTQAGMSGCHDIKGFELVLVEVIEGNGLKGRRFLGRGCL